MGHCPICGHELVPGTVVWRPEHRALITPAGRVVTFTVREAQVFEVLWHDRPAAVAWRTIVGRVWGYGIVERAPEANRGGEFRCPEILRTNLYRINRRLRGTGLCVRLIAPGSGWRIAIDED